MKATHQHACVAKCQTQLDGQNLLAVALVMVMALITTATAQPADIKPNVVFILADNVGYGDLGPYGGGELRGAPTPRIDQLAREGLRLTQYLVEPACTPSRAALMTGQYSIRNGLSLIIVPGSPNTLSKGAFTMGELFKGAGYATAIFGKWHLGAEPQSLPTAHGFDEFYGIPPDISWDSATYVDTIVLTHSINAPPDVLLAKGPQIVEAVAGGPLRTVKPFTREVRAEIDNELVAKSIDFMKRQKAAGKPFFLYLPFSMGHVPNLPVEAVRGQVADRPVRRQADGRRLPRRPDPRHAEGTRRRRQHACRLCLGQRAARRDCPRDWATRARRTWATPVPSAANWAKSPRARSEPSASSAGPARSSRAPARTRCSRSWTSCRPSPASSARKMPTDRPIDGVDQTDVLFGKSETGNRDSLLTFIGADLVAARWKQWRVYFTDVHPTGIGPQRQPGMFSASAPMAGYPKVYNIEMDPHEDLKVAGLFGWTAGPELEVVEKYLESVKKYPNPPAANITQFRGRSD